MDFKGIFFNPKDFTLTGKKLGKGAFGTVYIIEKNNDHTKYAAKIIESDENIDGNEQMQIMRESTILCKLDHPTILKFLGINFRSLKDLSIYQPTIITEFMPHGSLKEILDKEKNSIADDNWSPTKKYICLLGISNAMKYLHKMGILHRDLKPENILIDEDYYPRIADFGLAKCFPGSFSKSMNISMTGTVGTVPYMSPELIEGGKCGQGIDVYAFAILAYEIITGKEPYSEFKNLTPYQFWQRIIKGSRPTWIKGIPEKTRDLIEKCWSSDVDERPTFEEIFEMLSQDFSYSPEDVDSEEIDLYIEKIKSDEKPVEDDVKSKCVDIFKEQINSYDDFDDLFYEACEMGNAKIVEFLLSNKSIDVNKKVIFFHFNSINITKNLYF